MNTVNISSQNKNGDTSPKLFSSVMAVTPPPNKASAASSASGGGCSKSRPLHNFDLRDFNWPALVINNRTTKITIQEPTSATSKIESETNTAVKVNGNGKGKGILVVPPKRPRGIFIPHEAFDEKSVYVGREKVEVAARSVEDERVPLKKIVIRLPVRKNTTNKDDDDKRKASSRSNKSPVKKESKTVVEAKEKPVELDASDSPARRFNLRNRKTLEEKRNRNLQEYVSTVQQEEITDDEFEAAGTAKAGRRKGKTKVVEDVFAGLSLRLTKEEVADDLLLMTGKKKLSKKKPKHKRTKELQNLIDDITPGAGLEGISAKRVRPIETDESFESDLLRLLVS
ncbi:hypothetical protein ACFE04_018637 [Oxalis oulophora]